MSLKDKVVVVNTEKKDLFTKVNKDELSEILFSDLTDCIKLFSEPN